MLSVISAFLSMLFVFACSPLIPLVLAEEGNLPVLIGATVSNEGKYKEPSEMIQKAYRLWETEINAGGGLLGRPVRLVLYDDKSDPEHCSHLYEKLITRDRVDLVLSPYSSSLTLVASEVTEKHGFVILASGASAEKIWERGYRNIFGIYATAGRYFIGFLDLCARNGIETAGIIYENSSFHSAAARGARDWAGRFGIEVPFFKGYEDSTGRLPGLLDRLIASKVNALIVCSYPSDAHALISLMKEAGYRPGATAITIAPILTDFYDRAGSFAEGIFGPSQWEADERIPFPGTKDFITGFKKKYGKNPSYHAGSAYAACRILERAVTQLGSMEQFRIRNYISALDTVTVIGRFKVDETGRQVGHNPILVQWQAGKKEIVYPIRMKTAKPRFKFPE